MFADALAEQTIPKRHRFRQKKPHEATSMIFRGFDSNDKKCYSIRCKGGDGGNHGDENDLSQVIFGLPALFL